MKLRKASSIAFSSRTGAQDSVIRRTSWQCTEKSAEDSSAWWRSQFGKPGIKPATLQVRWDIASGELMSEWLGEKEVEWSATFLPSKDDLRATDWEVVPAHHFPAPSNSAFMSHLASRVRLALHL